MYEHLHNIPNLFRRHSSISTKLFITNNIFFSHLIIHNNTVLTIKKNYKFNLNSHIQNSEREKEREKSF